jgi:hypothetical protein
VVNKALKFQPEDFAIDFALSDLQRSLREAVARVCARFDDEYWLKRDRDGEFPEEFRHAIAEPAGSESACRKPTAALVSGSPRRRS